MDTSGEWHPPTQATLVPRDIARLTSKVLNSIPYADQSGEDLGTKVGRRELEGAVGASGARAVKLAPVGGGGGDLRTIWDQA